MASDSAQDTIPEYREMLCEIGTTLKQQQVRAAAYLCHGKIPDDELDGVTDGLKLMTLIEKHKLIKPNCNDWKFLINLLQSKAGIDSSDLADKVTRYAEERESIHQRPPQLPTTPALIEALQRSTGGISGSNLDLASNADKGNKGSSKKLNKFNTFSGKDSPRLKRRGGVRLSLTSVSSSFDEDTASETPFWQFVTQHPDWNFAKLLAVGESTFVFKAQRVQKTRSVKTDRVLSMLPVQQVAAKVFRTLGAIKNERTFLRQVNVLEDVQSHDNIVRLLTVIANPFPPLLVLELSPYGDLQRFLQRDEPRIIGQERLLRYAAQVADGMSYLETGGFIHGNLRASNVLLFDEDVVKISGFSLARHVDDDCDIDEDAMLPLRWTAIEVILYRQFKLKSDVWSFGIFLVELFTYGNEPYPDMEQGTLLSELRRGYRHPKPPSCPTGVYEDILQLCWKLKPAERPAFAVLRTMIDSSLKLPDYHCSSQGSSQASSRSYRHEAGLSSVSAESVYLAASVPDMQSVWKTEGWEVGPSSIQLKERLGTGQFGKVFKGVLDTGKEVAVKTLTVQHLSPESFLKEAHFMTSLKPHPHIVELLGICTKPNTEMFIVTELMTEGDLNRFLRNDGGQTLKLAALMRYATQVCDAMSYIESLRAVHRDIATRNVLVADSGNTVKLCDFGMARFLTDSEYRILGDVSIPVRWTAPEVLKSRMYTIKADVWAFGVLLVELITYGETPYPEMNVTEVVAKTKAGHRHPQPGNCPDNIYELMIKCWRSDPLARPSFKELYAILVELHAAMSTSNGI